MLLLQYGRVEKISEYRQKWALIRNINIPLLSAGRVDRVAVEGSLEINRRVY